MLRSLHFSDRPTKPNIEISWKKLLHIAVWYIHELSDSEQCLRNSLHFVTDRPPLMCPFPDADNVKVKMMFCELFITKSGADQMKHTATQKSNVLASWRAQQALLNIILTKQNKKTFYLRTAFALQGLQFCKRKIVFE